MGTEARDNSSAPRTGIGRGRRQPRSRPTNDEANAAPEQPRIPGRGAWQRYYTLIPTWSFSIQFWILVSDTSPGQNNNRTNGSNNNNNARTDVSNNNNTLMDVNDILTSLNRPGRSHGRRSADESQSKKQPIMETNLQKMVKAQQQKWSEKEEADNVQNGQSKNSRGKTASVPLDLSAFSEATRDVGSFSALFLYTYTH